MSRTYHHGERRIKIRGIRREQPDLRRIARAVQELAEMRAEAQAEAEHRRGIDSRPEILPPEPKPEPGSGATE